LKLAETVGMIDYGAGNMGNARRALDELGIPHRVVREPAELDSVGTVLLPGVGNYGAAMRQLSQTGLDDALRRVDGGGRPIVGICLGLQLMLSSSEEAPDLAGLGLLPGRVRRLDAPGLAVPHLGWAPVGARGTPYYFAHSFVVEPSDRSTVLASAFYGQAFPAVVRRGTLLGFQFHPERSGDPGLDLLRRALRRELPAL